MKQRSSIRIIIMPGQADTHNIPIIMERQSAVIKGQCVFHIRHFSTGIAFAVGLKLENMRRCGFETHPDLISDIHPQVPQ